MYKKIMVPLDGSKLAETVFPHVETVLHGCSAPEVVFVQAVEPISIPIGREVSQLTSFEQVKTFETHQRADAEKYLQEVVARFQKAGTNARLEVINGKPADALSEYAAKSGVDLIIMATHGRSGIPRLVMGSVADRLMRSTCAPVLLVRSLGCPPASQA